MKARPSAAPPHPKRRLWAPLARRREWSDSHCKILPLLFFSLAFIYSMNRCFYANVHCPFCCMAACAEHACVRSRLVLQFLKQKYSQVSREHLGETLSMRRKTLPGALKHMQVMNLRPLFFTSWENWKVQSNDEQLGQPM